MNTKSVCEIVNHKFSATYLLFIIASFASNVYELDPCELLNDQLIQEFFEVNVSELNRNTSGSSNLTCTVDWVKPNIKDLEKEHQAAMSKYMQDKIAGKDVEFPTYPSNNQVTLTIYKAAFKDKTSAQQSFNTAMQKLQTGTVAEINGKTETMFQYETIPVENVADDAHWVNGLSQLSVLSGTRIFHLRVKVYDNAEKNRSSAEAIAIKLAESLY